MLARIAAMIGCPVEALQRGELPDTPLGQAVELLRLWLMIDAKEDRRKILVLARSLAGPRAPDAAP